MAPRERVADFAELLDAYEANRIVVETSAYRRDPPEPGRLTDESDGADAVLLVGRGRRGPQASLDGPVLVSERGTRRPVAWLPSVNPEVNRRFAATAARVQRRGRRVVTLALLGQWHPRYLKLADWVEDSLGDDVRTIRWTGERIGREALVDALGSGLGLALYVGHGRPSGWAGYWGVRARHFAGFLGEPLGAVLSICCLTASRRRVGLSYCEALPLQGVAAASFGAVRSTSHIANARCVARLCESLGALGASTIGELIVRALAPDSRSLAAYRIVGDPLAPLSATTLGAQRAAAVAVHP